MLAANAETISRGVFLLAVYSAGLAVPFLLTAIGINQFLGFYQRFRSYLHAVEVLSGVLLLFVGGLIFLNRLTWLSGKLGFLNKFALVRSLQHERRVFFIAAGVVALLAVMVWADHKFPAAVRLPRARPPNRPMRPLSP